MELARALYTSSDFKSVFGPASFHFLIFRNLLFYMFENNSKDEIHVDGLAYLVFPIQESDRGAPFIKRKMTQKCFKMYSMILTIFQANHWSSSDTKKLLFRCIVEVKFIWSRLKFHVAWSRMRDNVQSDMYIWEPWELHNLSSLWKVLNHMNLTASDFRRVRGKIKAHLNCEKSRNSGWSPWFAAV